MNKIFLFFVLCLCLCCKFVSFGQIITTVDSIGCYDIGGIAFDVFGNLYFPTFLGCQIKKMDTNFVTSVIAGNGTSGFGGDGGPATDALLNQPSAVAIDSIGNVFFTDVNNMRIRKIERSTGIITTVAGTGSGGVGSGGFFGDGGLATNAKLKSPVNLCFDKFGNLYFSDGQNFRIRKIDTNGIIKTVAGQGLTGIYQDYAPATASIVYPGNGIAVDSVGILYFTETKNTIRKVGIDGIISTIAGDTTYYIYNGDNIPATNAHLSPAYLTIGKDGLLYSSDGNERIRQIDGSGIIHTIAGNGICCYSGDGGPATAAKINPTGIAFDQCGNLFFGQITNPRIRKIAFDTSCHIGTTKLPETPPNDINIYPNPATTEISIDNIKGEVNYCVFNIIGIIEHTGMLKSGSNRLNIKTLTKGLHLIEITDGEGMKSIKKFIKE